MCNEMCLNFVEKYIKPEEIVGKKILEIGSLDINGSPQTYLKSFNPQEYVGIDLQEGKGVDKIIDVLDLLNHFKENSFDYVICHEVLEHIQDWKKAIFNMKYVLKINGKIILTTRSPGFPIHGAPYDYWRFTKENIHYIFNDFSEVIVEDDESMPGVFICGKKINNIIYHSNITPEAILIPKETIHGMDKELMFVDNNKNFGFLKADQIPLLPYRNTIESIYTEIFRHEEYNHPKCNIRYNDIVVDIGGNIGMFSRYAHLKGALKIYSYEPEPNNFKCLNYNKPENCEAFNYAVTSNLGEREFFLDSRNIGGHSFIKSELRNSSLNVKCITLENILEMTNHINYLKIDIEGTEKELFDNIDNKIFNHIDKICVECHNVETGDNFKYDLQNKLDEWYESEIIDHNPATTSILYFWKKIKLPFDYIIGHTSWVSKTGYSAHARDFFTRLNDFIPVRIRNFAYHNNLDHLSEKQKDMMIEQHWSEPPFQEGKPFIRKPTDRVLNIILMESNHHYYYDKYEGPVITYNVWESTEQPEQFFKRSLEISDQFWCPTKWQAECTIKQGWNKEKVFVIPEGVNGKIYNPDPIEPLNIYSDKRFKFLIFGRWDYRKYTTEMIRAFLSEFKKDEPVDLIISVDNPFPVDNLNNTKERLDYHGFNDSRIKDIGFVSNEDYVNYLKNGNVFLSCSRSEGWNLPLIEAIACGTPTICSSHGAQLEFAKEISHIVKTIEQKKPKNVFMQNDTPGLWDEPDFEDLKRVMRDVYNNYEKYKKDAIEKSKEVINKFSWSEAVYKALDVLSSSDFTNRFPIKLNIGSGISKLNDYVNIDKYDNSADIKCDAKELPYDNNSIDEIYSSHALEHFSKFEILDVLSEWNRVLKPNGILKLEVPNLEWVLKNWLDSEEDDRWGFKLDTIFGLETNEGEFHKTGFTKKRIEKFLCLSGFGDIKIKNVWSHDQDCLYTESKKMEYNDDIFVLSCYPDTDEKIKILINKINELKKLKKPIAIVSHYLLPHEVVKMVDYFIYDSNNPLSIGWSLNYWYQKSNDLKIVGKYETSYHGAAVYTNIKNAADFLREKYNFYHFIEADILVDNLKNYINKVKKLRLHGKKFIGFSYSKHKDTPGITTNIFSVDIKWLASKIPNIFTWNDYNNEAIEINKRTKRRIDLIFEYWIYMLFEDRDMLEHCELMHPIDFINIQDQGLKEPSVRKLFCEIAGGKFIKFLINDTDHIIRVQNKIDINPHDYHYEILDFAIPTPNTYFKFFDDKMICPGWNSNDYNFTSNVKNNNDLFKISYHRSPKLEIIGNSNEKYDILFKEQPSEIIVHAERNLGVGYWTSPSRQYYTDWKIEVLQNDNVICTETFDPKGKNVLIYIDSKALGDSIAWIPYIEEFRKKHNCEVYVASHWNEIFNYPNLKFIKPGTIVKDCYVIYEIGCRNEFSNKNNWRTINLQQVASDYLGLNFTPLKANIKTNIKKEKIKKKFVAISEHSTLQCKLWNFPNGWQILIDELKKTGIEVVSISAESSFLKNIIKRNHKTIFETIDCLKDAQLFIGVSSGLSWLAYSLNIPVVMISGVTLSMHEFDCYRVNNENVCNGCWNDIDIKIDKGNRMWCPHNKNFECTSSITPKMIIDIINENKLI